MLSLLQGPGLVMWHGRNSACACLGTPGRWPGTERTLGNAHCRKEGGAGGGGQGSGALSLEFSETAPSPLETQHYFSSLDLQ